MNAVVQSGGAEEDRTPDLRIANATLSQLSYGPTRSRQFTTGQYGKSMVGDLILQERR